MVTLRTPDPERLAAALRARFGGEARVAGPEQVVVERANGAEFVPQVAAAFPDLVRAITLRQPTLDDVFIKLTGRSIRDEPASPRDAPRRARRTWLGRR